MVTRNDELERAAERDQVGGMQQARVVRQRHAAGVAERQPEQPGHGGQRDDADQQQAGSAQAAQHPLLRALLGLYLAALRPAWPGRSWSARS